MVFLGNYSSTFRVWDWLFGTDHRYNTWKQRQKMLATKQQVGGIPSEKEE
jgi:sterol desaturase/sphingolipid hydroxylase (fatty acid hydroxylase superfamily)